MPNLRGASPVNRGDEGCSDAARSVCRRGLSSCHKILEEILGAKGTFRRPDFSQARRATRSNANPGVLAESEKRRSVSIGRRRSGILQARREE